MSKEALRKSISTDVTLELWGKAAGRCEFEGCNRILYQHHITGQDLNCAQRAHIWAVSDKWTRGDKLEKTYLDDINNVNNLMLVCYACHKLIDSDKEEKLYTAKSLIAMKVKHEKRIFELTDIKEDKKTRPIIYCANIGNNRTLIDIDKVRYATTPDFYPTGDISLSLLNSSLFNGDPNYWEMELQHLKRQFIEKVSPLIQNSDIKHFSIFALAPQPLLFSLGMLLGNKVNSKVYQLHKEPCTWKWEKFSAKQCSFKATETIVKDSKDIALIISISANIDFNSVVDAMKPYNQFSYYTIEATEPDNDGLRSYEQLIRLINLYKHILNDIKKRHPSGSKIHLFSASPVSFMIAAGMNWDIDVDLPIILYNRYKTKFIKAIGTIKEG